MTLSIVISGWYFKNEDIYRAMVDEVESFKKDVGSRFDIKYHIASHKAQQGIGKYTLDSIKKLGWNFVCFENEGWGWGAYQQFLHWQEKNGGLSDYYLFLQDDIKIKNHGFLKALFDKIDQGAKVVGNGTAVSKSDAIRQYFPEDILWAEMKGFLIKSHSWNVVRGSCVFMVRDVAEKVLMKMPIKKGLCADLANSSMRIFGALVVDTFGEDAIAHIGDKSGISFYIEEEHKGSGMRAGRKNRGIVKTCLDLPLVRNTAIRLMRGKRTPGVIKGSGLKLNLGCGKQCLPGYFNVDVNNPHADMNQNILDLEFPEESVAEILMVHIIEHIELADMPALFTKMHKWLKTDGQLILEFPDVIKVCKSVLKYRKDPEKLQQSPYGLRGLYGKPRDDMTIYDYHKWGWTGTNMVPVLNDIGFNSVNVEGAHYHCFKRDTRIVAVK